ncbi:cache domain-containing protein [Saccharomonospora viridis]|jgi:hypothetical protein|uniref:Uncharacterized protein n=1 Tax=Saccharomonospora viridis TaxID=1852 RepID=A0A837D643_9PSEU|nr:cache domain-containing protein [Saccharomonospora viridis]KHF42932.1 hypothetical protein MINT15_31340 [Saccharomonospora viridis]SFO88117.1 hypothetical protein SAMN02982918_0632 [Saccharomonospora viridis]
MLLTSDNLRTCAAEIGKVIDPVFTVLQRNARKLADLWAAGSKKPTREDLATMRGLFHSELETHPVLDGVGFIAEQNALGDVERHIEWLHHSPANGEIEPLSIDLNRSSLGNYDYENRPYIQRPRSGLLVIDGPYVDYLARNAYILTFGAPVVVDGRFVGTSGADVRVTVMENMLLPILLCAGVAAAVLNVDGRVVASNVADVAGGERLRQPDGIALTIDGMDVGWRLHRLD